MLAGIGGRLVLGRHNQIALDAVMRLFVCQRSKHALGDIDAAAREYDVLQD